MARPSRVPDELVGLHTLIRKAIDRSGRSVASLARDIGRGAQSVSLWTVYARPREKWPASPGREPTNENLLALADALSTGPDDPGITDEEFLAVGKADVVAMRRDRQLAVDLPRTSRAGVRLTDATDEELIAELALRLKRQKG